MIIVVGNEKGGVAKTATATNLAVRAVEAGIDTLLIDTDSQGTSRAWCRIRNETNQLPFIPLKTEIDNFRKELLHESTKYELLIVDIGAQNYKALTESAVHADLIIVPTGADQFEVESTIKVMRALKKLDDEHRDGRCPAWVLMNRTPNVRNSREEAALRECLIDAGMPVFDTVLRDRSVWRTSRREGRAVHEVCGRTKMLDPKAGAEAESLFDEVMEKLANSQQARLPSQTKAKKTK